jgi:hypothetical protein
MIRRNLGQIIVLVHRRKQSRAEPFQTTCRNRLTVLDSGLQAEIIGNEADNRQQRQNDQQNTEAP